MKIVSELLMIISAIEKVIVLHIKNDKDADY